ERRGHVGRHDAGDGVRPRSGDGDEADRLGWKRLRMAVKRSGQRNQGNDESHGSSYWGLTLASLMRTAAVSRSFCRNVAKASGEPPTGSTDMGARIFTWNAAS